MTYRQSSASGVPLHFRRRERFPPLYGPPTAMEHHFQRAIRAFAKQTFDLYARTNAWIAGAEWPSEVKILHPDGRPETLRINRIKP